MGAWTGGGSDSDSGGGGGTTPPAQYGNYVVQGGGVNWLGTGFQYTISAAEYVIGGMDYSSPQTNLTLAAADPTNPRIDVFALTTAGTAIIIPGTPAASPAQPAVDSTTQLAIGFVFVAAAATSPQVTNTSIYLNNAEWTATSSSARINVDSTSNPFAGTKDIEATLAVANDFVTLTNGAPVVIGNSTNLTMQLRSKATWPSAKRLTFQWRNGVSNVGNAVQISPSGTFGFVSSTVGVYQSLSIPIANFGVGLTPVTNLRITVTGTGAGIGFYLDNIIAQAGVASGGGGATSDPTEDMTFRGDYSAATAYNTQDTVTSGGVPYVAIQPGTGNTPASSPLFWTPIASSGGLTNFTEAVSIAAPNATVPVVSLTATNAATNVDAAFRPKGSGAITAHVADNTTTGGNKRGARAVDLQMTRAVNTQVAAGVGSVLISQANATAGSDGSVVIGGNTSSGSNICTAGGQSTNSAIIGGTGNSIAAVGAAILGGAANTIGLSGTQSFIAGCDNMSVNTNQGVALGSDQASVTGNKACLIGGTNGSSASGAGSFCVGAAVSSRGISYLRAFCGGTDEIEDISLLIFALTTDATQTTLSSTGGAASTSTQLTVPNNGNGGVLAVRGTIAAKQITGAGTGSVSAWEFTCVVKNIGGTTSIVGDVTLTLIAQDAGAAAWAVAIDANDTLDCLRVRVTGEASKLIRWGCTLHACQT